MRNKSINSSVTIGNSNRLRFYLASVLMLSCFAISGHAQDGHRFTADIGGGFTPPTGALSNRLGPGGNFGVSGGINITQNLSASLKFSANWLGVNRSLLNQVGTPNGNAHVWSLTVDPKFRVRTVGRVSPYVVGGVGYYRRTIDFFQPIVINAAVFDPIFETSFPIVLAENQTVRRVTRDGIGGKLGGGFDLRLGDSGVKFFTEARYEYANTRNIPTRMVPVEFGFRW